MSEMFNKMIKTVTGFKPVTVVLSYLDLKIMRKISLKSKRKGSATVEAAMIFPLIMFIIFGIIYFTIIHYQNNVMIAESIRAMNRAGAYWQYSDMNHYGQYIKYNDDNIPAPFDSTIPSNGIINKEMIKNRNPYRSIIDLIANTIGQAFGIQNQKNLNSEQYVTSRIANIKFKQYEPDTKVGMKGQYINGDKVESGGLKNGGFMFFGDDLKINVGRSYINPMINWAKVFMGNNSLIENAMKKNIEVSSVISNQAEFIRNLDTVYDMGVNIYDLVTPEDGK